MRYFGSQAWPLPASLLMAFTVEVSDDAIAIDESEIVEARFFTRDDLEGVTTSSRVSLSGRMIEEWRAGASA